MKNFSLQMLALLTFISCSSTQQPHNQAPAEGQRPDVGQLISEMDTDKDGKLSKSEAKGPLVNAFAQIDANSDGYLTADEISNGDPNRPPNHDHGHDHSTSASLSDAINTNIPVLPVNTDYFISENIIGEIEQQRIELNGVETLCYVIKTNSRATEHPMGPWCPKHIEDGIEKAGIWFKDDKVYDVSGHFIANLDEFYGDEKWKLYREDGTIKVTDTKEGCLAAAKPNVEEAYQNHCVECMPDYFKDQVTTFVIPAKPVYVDAPQSFGRGGIGLAFNGVKYDPPAPTHAILAAHTIAPLDDHGGHVNPHGGYHYHAVTGSTKEVAQPDAHAPIIGYAIDGFGIYALLDKNGNKPTDLDACGGHVDSVRGYHYHAGEPGGNQIIKCLHGIPGYSQVAE